MSDIKAFLARAPLLSRLIQRLEATVWTKKLASGTSWTFFGNLIWRFFSAVSTISVARILGPQGFGELGIILSTVRMFSVYAGFRLGSTATKYVAEFKNSNPVKAARILRLALVGSFALCVLVSVGLLLSASTLAETLLHRPEMAMGLAFGAVLLFLLIYSEVNIAGLTGFEAFRTIAKINVVRGVITPIACIPLAYFLGVEGAIAGLIVVGIFVVIQASILLKRTQKTANFPTDISYEQIKPEMYVLWKFALPGFLVGAILTIVLWFARLLLVETEAGYVQLGIFEAANQWRTLILFLPAILVRVILPILSESYSDKSTDTFARAISLQLRSICIISLPLVIFVVGFSEPIAALFGRAFEGTDSVIVLLMLSVFFFALNQSLRVVFDGSGKRWVNLAMYLSWSILYYYLCRAFIPSMGAMGLALAHLISEGALLFVQVAYVDRVIAPKVLRSQFPLLAFALSLLAACYVIQVTQPDIYTIPILVALFLVSLKPGLKILKS